MVSDMIDLKKIDIDQIIQILKEHRNTVLKLAVVIGALVIAGIMFNDYHIKEAALYVRISQMQKKLDAITSQKGAIKGLNDFKVSFPKGISEDQSITQITSYATAQNVSISTFSPTEDQDMGLYSITKVSFTGTAPDYRDMVLFLRDIEESPYLFRVDSWSGNGHGEINFTMAISAVHVHL